jgi:hypothetical protein
MNQGRSHRTRTVKTAAIAITALAAIWSAAAIGLAQAPARGATPPAGRSGTAPAGRGGAGQKVDANLAQLMRGIIYPSSNVVFAAQSDLNFPPVKDPATSPNLLTSTYGGWQAVESAALGLAESANLLTIPGRMCSNGVPAPITRPDWIKFTQGLREAGLAAYKAAQMKNQDAMVDASGTVADACSACHDVYREKKGGLPDRCKP